MMTQSKNVISGGTVVLLTSIGVWGGAVAILTAQGFFKSLYPPLIAPIVFLGVTAPSLVYFGSPPCSDILRRLG